MAKLPNSSDFKLDLPGARRGKPGGPPEPPPAAASEASVAKRPRPSSVAQGTKSLTFYPSKDGWLQLRMLSGRLDRPAQDLLLDALDALFRDHGLPAISRGLPTKEDA